MILIKTFLNIKLRTSNDESINLRTKGFSSICQVYLFDLTELKMFIFKKLI